MTCENLHSEILALANPREVTASHREHLAACPACQAWLKRVQALEGLVAQLPVPTAPANKKAAFIAHLREGMPIIHDRPTPRSPSPFTRQRIAAVAGLAASVAAVVGLIVLTRGPSNKTPVVQMAPTHPFLERVVHRNVAIAKSATPADRLASLGLLADDIRLEARDLARVASVEDLKALAGWYDKLVREGLVSQAETMPALAMDPVAKATLLRDLAGKLSSAGSETERLMGDVPPAAQESMRRMAETARDGQQKLRQLAGGA